MFINVPNKLTKHDIKYCGCLMKDEGYSYVLSDLDNTNINNTFKLSSRGFYSYVYNIYDTYLFIIGNQIGNKDIKPNKIDFLSKILKFEYMLENKDKKIFKADIPSKVLTITASEKWGLIDLDAPFYKNAIKNIYKNQPFLRKYDTYKRFLLYLCSNSETNMGVHECYLSKDLLTTDYVFIYKDTDIDGYIIKTEHSKFL